jgi:glyoxylase-like metal-dependent hydrolase (beta-lactamase superfamily II)
MTAERNPERPCPVAGVKRIEIPLTTGPGSVCVFLIAGEDGWVAVDCGPNSDEALDCYRRAGIELKQIRTILLTHAHPDHCGLAARLQAISGAEILLHRDEHVALQKLSDPDEWLAGQDEILEAAAVPAVERRKIRVMSRMLRTEFPEFDVAGYLEDGDVFLTEQGELEVLLTPGHTAGHVCFYLRDRKALFAGDHLVLGPHPHLDWAPSRDLADEYMDSLCRLATFEIDWVLNAHGRPRPDGNAVITGVLTRFWERCEKVESDARRTPYEVAGSLFRRELGPFELRMAIFEVLTILRYPVLAPDTCEVERLAA